MCFPLEPDVLDDIALPNPEKEVSEEEIEKSNEKKSEAIQAFQSEEFESATKLYTVAIDLNPSKFSIIFLLQLFQ